MDNCYELEESVNWRTPERGKSIERNEPSERARPFETVHTSPDAKDLLESSYQFATEVPVKAASDYEAVLAGILKPLIKKQSRSRLSAAQFVQFMAGAMLSLKGTAKNTKQLRELLAEMIKIVLTSLQ